MYDEMKTVRKEAGMDNEIYNILYICISMTKAKDRVSIPVSLPMGLVEEIDDLVDHKLFGSRSEVLRYGARLAVIYHRRLHTRAEEYALDEIEAGLKRGKDVS